MCDTLVVTPAATRDGVTVFAKNSDREPNEAQHLVFIGAQNHPPGQTVSCTYIEIPQASHTHAVVLSKPFWIWGAEMGANEHGVAIGNEAVFSRIPAQRQPALLGMDLLRLSLERGHTAYTTLEVMIELLERYGQGGNCGCKQKTFYHNSFIIADPQEAWVLETVDRQWATKRIRGVYAISNGLTLGNDLDNCSKNLVSEAVMKKWCKGRGDFHFAKCYSDHLYTRFSDSRRRRSRAMALLEEMSNGVDLSAVISILRDHGDSSCHWNPGKGITGCTICMHAGFGPVRISQTTGSMASYLHPDRATHFFTATAAPCTSVFKPVWTDVPIPEAAECPSGAYDDSTWFWRHEKLHRATLKDYAYRLSLYDRDRDALEKDMIATALALAPEDAHARSEFSQSCFKKARNMEDLWLDRLKNADRQNRPNRLYARAWNTFNRKALMTDDC